MTKHRRLFACCALLGLTAALSAQDGPNVRKVEDKGVYFTLAAPWQWQGDNDVIAIKHALVIKDVEHEIEADLVYETKRMADDVLKDIQQKVDGSKGSFKNLKITKKAKLGTVKCSTAFYVKVKGEGPDAKEFEERVYVFKRGDGSFSWTERCPKPASGAASSLFDAARKGFKFVETAETKIPTSVEIEQPKGSYKLPEDFEWANRAELKSGEKDAKGPAVDVYTVVDVKGDEFRCNFEMVLQVPNKGEKMPDVAGLAEQMKNFDPAKDITTSDSAGGKHPVFFDVQEVKIDRKGDLSGDKALAITWTAHRGDKNGPKVRCSWFWMNKKGVLVNWREEVPWTKAPVPELTAAVKAARAGINL